MCFIFFIFSLNAVRLFGRLFTSRERVTWKNSWQRSHRWEGWGYFGKYLLGMCRWHLRAPTPIMTILWPTVDPILVTYGQICNFRDPNIESLSIVMNWPIFLDWMKHLQCKHSGTFAYRKCEELSHPKKSENVRPYSWLVTLLKIRPHCSHIQSWKSDPIQQHIRSPLASYKEVRPPP